MSRISRFAMSLATGSLTLAVAASAAPAEQAGAFPPASLRNLQVLSKDTSVPVVIDLMKGFTRSLGVRCDHCHVGVDGQPLTTFDFVSDEKKTKQTARAMMRLVGQINTTLNQSVPGATVDRVTCFTCHNGSVRPGK